MTSDEQQQQEEEIICYQVTHSFLSQFSADFEEPLNAQQSLRELLKATVKVVGDGPAVEQRRLPSSSSHLTVEEHHGIPFVRWSQTAEPATERRRPYLELLEAYTRLACEKSSQLPVLVRFRAEMQSRLASLFQDQPLRREDKKGEEFIRCAHEVLGLCEGEDAWRDLFELTLRQFVDATRTAGVTAATEVPAFLYHYCTKQQQISTMGYDGQRLNDNRPFCVARSHDEFERRGPYDCAYWPDGNEHWPVLRSIAPTRAELGLEGGMAPVAYQVRWASSVRNCMQHDGVAGSVMVLLDPIAGRTPMAVHIKTPSPATRSSSELEEATERLVVSHYSLPPAAAFAALRRSKAAAPATQIDELLASLSRCMRVGLELLQHEWTVAYPDAKPLYMGLLMAYEPPVNEVGLGNPRRDLIGGPHRPQLHHVSCSRSWPGLSVTVGALARRALRSTNHSAFFSLGPDARRLPAALDVLSGVGVDQFYTAASLKGAIIAARRGLEAIEEARYARRREPTRLFAELIELLKHTSASGRKRKRSDDSEAKQTTDDDDDDDDMEEEEEEENHPLPSETESADRKRNERFRPLLLASDVLPQAYDGPHKEQLCHVHEFEQEEWQVYLPRLPVGFAKCKMADVDGERFNGKEWTYGYFFVHAMEDKLKYLRLHPNLDVPIYDKHGRTLRKRALDEEYKGYWARKLAKERWPEEWEENLPMVRRDLDRVEQTMKARIKLAKQVAAKEKARAPPAPRRMNGSDGGERRSEKQKKILHAATSVTIASSPKRAAGYPLLDLDDSWKKISHAATSVTIASSPKRAAGYPLLDLGDSWKKGGVL